MEFLELKPGPQVAFNKTGIQIRLWLSAIRRTLFLMFVLQLSLGCTCLAGVTKITLESSISLSLLLFE